MLNFHPNQEIAASDYLKIGENLLTAIMKNYQWVSGVASEKFWMLLEGHGAQLVTLKWKEDQAENENGFALVVTNYLTLMEMQ